jgi:thioredoxin 1
VRIIDCASLNREAPMSEAIKRVTDDSFEREVLASPLPVLVDYWAEWCGPCKMIAPMLDESAASYAGQVSIAKVNADENPKVLTQYQVRSLPTLMLFKDGKPVATKIGALSRSQLSAFIEEHI